MTHFKLTKKAGFPEIVNRCGWCGDTLPPYSEWKWVLCPKCEKDLKANKLRTKIK